MKAETLKALKASIAHWRRLATGKNAFGEEPYGDDCPLCDLFYHRGEWMPCQGCPVSKRAKDSSCRNTPWSDAAMAYRKFGANSEIFHRAATKQLKFLQSLLPRKEAK